MSAAGKTTLTIPGEYTDMDDEIRSFIKRTEGFYQDQNMESVSSQRACYNAMCRAFASPCPENVSSVDFHLDSGGYQLPVRKYIRENRNSRRCIVYYHGGGFVVGDLESHHSICADICSKTGYDLFAVDYRLAPEHHFPDDIEDALTAFRYATRHFNEVIVMGDSAGGTLAAGVSIATRNSVIKPHRQILIYPALGGDGFGLTAYSENSSAPMLTTEDVHYYHAMRAQSVANPLDPLFSPLQLEDMTGMPPCHAFSADIDPLRDDSKFYVDKLKHFGVAAEWTNEPGLVHGYLRARTCSLRGMQGFTRICDAITLP